MSVYIRHHDATPLFGNTKHEGTHGAQKQANHVDVPPDKMTLDSATLAAPVCLSSFSILHPRASSNDGPVIIVMMDRSSVLFFVVLDKHKPHHLVE